MSGPFAHAAPPDSVTAQNSTAPSVAISRRSHRARLPCVGVTYSIQRVSTDAPHTIQNASLDPTQPMSLVLEPRFFPSRSKAPCDTIPHHFSVDMYNGKMREMYLQVYTPEVASLLSHVIQEAIFEDAEDYVSGLITNADPTQPLRREQADTCRAVTTAFTNVMTQLMDERYGPGNHPSVSFVDPSEWAEKLNESDPHAFITGLGKSVGGKGKSRTILSAGMSNHRLSRQTKLEVYIKGANNALWSIRPDGRKRRRRADFTASEADEAADFGAMSARELHDVVDEFYY